MTFRYAAILTLLLYSTHLQAFDDDFSINRPDFNTEHYLDIHKAGFDEDLEEQWYATENGWRISSHSLTEDLTYLHTQIKLKHELSEYINMRLYYDQEIEIADQPVQPPGLELEYRPLPEYPLGLSVIGSFQYQKSGSEKGFAATYGNRTSNFIRYSDTKLDGYHNQKTDDDSRYLEFQHVYRLEAGYHWTEKVHTYIDYSSATPMTFLFDDQVTQFGHDGHQYMAFLKYKYSADNHYKVIVKGFSNNKSLTGTTDERQTLDYTSIDLRWLTAQTQLTRYSVGYRYDKFHNTIYSTLDDSIVLDYPFRTRQLYATMTRRYSPHNSWQLGLYAGKTNEINNFTNPSTDHSNVTEMKLNMVWAHHTVDNRASIFFHFSWNLDNLAEDRGDGGGITYQSTF